MIQAIMFVSLGFLTATLLALLIAPAAWARAVRLTSHRIRTSLPINEIEIRAEKDQLRASHAVTVHQLEKKIESAELSAARQRVELSRRDAQISELTERESHLSAMLDENKNARHVLAQTLNERLPRAEERLQETRGLLKARDDQVAKFVAAATTQRNALVEAEGLIAQKDQELRRLNAALLARESAARQQFESASHEQFVALQAEVHELRARNATHTANNAGLLDRIRQTSDAGSGQGQLQENEDHVDQNVDLPEDETAVGAELESLLDESADQSAPMSRFSRGLSQLQGLLQREKETTHRLRAELASANDRAAQLAAHYRDELRRFTPDDRPAPPQPPETNGSANVGEPDVPSEPKRQSVLDRVNALEEDKPAAPSKEENGSAARALKTSSEESEDAKDGATCSDENDASTGEKSALAQNVASSNEKSSKTGTLLQRLKGYEKS